MVGCYIYAPPWSMSHSLWLRAESLRTLFAIAVGRKPTAVLTGTTNNQIPTIKSGTWTMVERRYNTLPWKLSTFDNVWLREIHCSFKREHCLLKMSLINCFCWILERKKMAKMNNFHKHNGAEPPEAQDPMQLHRLHWLKAGPGHMKR